MSHSYSNEVQYRQVQCFPFFFDRERPRLNFQLDESGVVLFDIETDTNKGYAAVKITTLSVRHSVWQRQSASASLRKDMRSASTNQYCHRRARPDSIFHSRSHSFSWCPFRFKPACDCRRSIGHEPIGGHVSPIEGNSKGQASSQWRPRTCPDKTRVSDPRCSLSKSATPNLNQNRPN